MLLTNIIIKWSYGSSKNFQYYLRKVLLAKSIQITYAAIDKCVTCKIRSLQTQKAQVQETGISPFPFASLGIDKAGPYKTS